MTLRPFLLALVAGLLALGATGCNGGAAGGPQGNANLDSLATADPADLLAYNAGFETAKQLAEQDSTFDFERFREGFAAGLRGDSTEIAYALGLRAGLGLHADTVSNIDANVFLTGFREGLRGDSTRLTQAQIATANAAFQDSLQMRQLRTQAAANPEAQVQLGQIRANGDAARRFLAGVERRPGVRKTASGMLYTVTTPGRGPNPTDSDQVRITYVGKLADGTPFDQSPEGEPVQLPVAAVVPGFAEALKAMKPGETRTVWLPPNLAYGLAGAPGPDGQGGIPPNSALQFELTLVEIVAPEQGAPQGAFVPPSAGQ
ncbi:MAG TPA: FKBP-type peptidyl-prolyl cis-trans isomerase [Rubricoccaceae bacterium]